MLTRTDVEDATDDHDCKTPSGDLAEMRKQRGVRTADGKTAGLSSCCEHCGSSVNEQALKLLKDMGLIKGSPPPASAISATESNFLRLPHQAAQSSSQQQQSSFSRDPGNGSSMLLDHSSIA